MTPILLFIIFSYNLETLNNPKVYSDSIPQTKIGEQTWTSENLNVITFQNGDTIPQAQSAEEWQLAFEKQAPAWCWYEKNGVYLKEHGIIYNYYAISDSRQLAPKGWSIPSSSDFLKMHTFLESISDPCLALRDSTSWPKTTDVYVASGFNSSPSGYRGEYGFKYHNALVKYWTTSKVLSDHPRGLIDFYNIDRMGNCGIASEAKNCGAFVRCILKY